MLRTRNCTFRVMIVALCMLGLVVAQKANATPIQRNDFGTAAHNFSFIGYPAETETIISGNLTVSGGGVGEAGWANPEFLYLDSALLNPPITLSFLSPVSAVGADFVAYRCPVTLSVFSADDVLLESFTLRPQDVASDRGYPTGFLGIALTEDIIDHAVFTTTKGSNSIYIGSVVYEAAPVPEPSTCFLLGSGLAAGAYLRRRKSA